MTPPSRLLPLLPAPAASLPCSPPRAPTLAAPSRPARAGRVAPGSARAPPTPRLTEVPETDGDPPLLRVVVTPPVRPVLPDPAHPRHPRRHPRRPPRPAELLGALGHAQPDAGDGGAQRAALRPDGAADADADAGVEDVHRGGGRARLRPERPLPDGPAGGAGGPDADSAD